MLLFQSVFCCSQDWEFVTRAQASEVIQRQIVDGDSCQALGPVKFNLHHHYKASHIINNKMQLDETNNVFQTNLKTHYAVDAFKPFRLRSNLKAS